MLSCSMWFSVPSFWMGGGLESRCVGRVYGANGAVRLHGTIRTAQEICADGPYFPNKLRNSKNLRILSTYFIYKFSMTLTILSLFITN